MPVSKTNDGRLHLRQNLWSASIIQYHSDKTQMAFPEVAYMQ